MIADPGVDGRMEGKDTFAGDGQVFNMPGQHLSIFRHYSVNIKGSKERSYPTSLSSLALGSGCLLIAFLKGWTVFDTVCMT